MWLVSTQRLMLLISVMNFRSNLSQVDHLLLTDFMPVLFLYPLKTSAFMMLSGGVERCEWHELPFPGPQFR